MKKTILAVLMLALLASCSKSNDKPAVTWKAQSSVSVTVRSSAKSVVDSVKFNDQTFPNSSVMPGNSISLPVGAISPDSAVIYVNGTEGENLLFVDNFGQVTSVDIHSGLNSLVLVGTPGWKLNISYGLQEAQIIILNRQDVLIPE